MTVVRISDDALAQACGAEDVVAAFEQAGCTIERVSSWGMHWLEPLVEIAGIGFGPATAHDVAAILAGTSDKCIGVIADHPFIARQQRLTFARAGRTRPLSLEDYAATGGWLGLSRARTLVVPALLEGSYQRDWRQRPPPAPAPHRTKPYWHLGALVFIMVLHVDAPADHALQLSGAFHRVAFAPRLCRTPSSVQ